MVVFPASDVYFVILVAIAFGFALGYLFYTLDFIFGMALSLYPHV